MNELLNTMSTTEKYVKLEEYFTIENNKQQQTERIQTNSRYRNFQQVNFTAGDEEQFFQHISQKNGSTPLGGISDENIWKEYFLANSLPEASKNIGPCAVKQNFKYYFHTVKKGIFIKIKDGILEVFLPFSKNNFDNKWGNTLQMSDDQLNDIYRNCQTRSGRPFKPGRINKNKLNWIGNNFLVRNEYPVIEGDSNVSCLKHMFQTLLEKREIPDIEFFLNRRDFPLMRSDGTHPYGYNIPTKLPDNILPIFSMCSNNSFNDMAIPTWDDWCRIAYQNYNTSFMTSYINRLDKEYPNFNDNNTWKTKKDMFVFRGASTGKGVTIETNPRLKLATMKDNRLDVGITSWNLRPRVKLNDTGFVLETINESITDNISLKPTLSTYIQSQYKYIIHVPGHSCAFRLSLELAMNVVILIVKSEYSLWFFKYLKPDIHYISIKEDLSDLVEKMDWCCENPEKCAKIALAAREFYLQYLTEESILDFLQKSIVDAKSIIGDYKYNIVSSKDIIHRMELKIVKNLIRKSIPIKSQDTDWEQIWNSKTTLVEYNSEQNLVRKSVVDEKYEEFIHEIFIGSKIIPTLPSSNQFSKLKNVDKKYSYWEYIHGISLSKYLISDIFSLDVFYDILKQVMGILHTSLEKNKFCHHDVFPWNIILQKNDDKFVYHTQRGTWYSKSMYKVVLLDFGKSNSVYNNICFDSSVKPFCTSTIQDTIIF